MKNLSFSPVRKCSRRATGGLLFFPQHLRNRLALRIPFFLSLASLFSCGTVHVYNEADQPVFRSNEEKPQPVEGTDSLNVVTFNIKKAEKIELASSELRQLQETKNVDVYLLQEMDEQGVETIAKNLDLNYLYIPVVYNESLKKNMGNAILTRGTITRPEKLLLPHAKPLSKSRRQVTIAEVTIQQKKILVYSVHTETMVMSLKNRMDQVDAIIEHASQQLPDYKYVLIGGDFNTLSQKNGQMAIDKFRSNGFNWSSSSAGKTASAFFGLLKPRHDYIFSKGLNVTDCYKIESSKSSDHFPVFATFSYDAGATTAASKATAR